MKLRQTLTTMAKELRQKSWTEYLKKKHACIKKSQRAKGIEGAQRTRNKKQGIYTQR